MAYRACMGIGAQVVLEFDFGREAGVMDAVADNLRVKIASSFHCLNWINLCSVKCTSAITAY